MQFSESDETGEANYDTDARNWATLTHLSSLTGYVTGGLGFVAGPLIMWLLRKDRWGFVDDQGKEALNFNIVVCIAGIICFFLAFLLIGIPLLLVLALVQIVFSIVAALNASRGVQFRYPQVIRFVQ